MIKLLQDQNAPQAWALIFPQKTSTQEARAFQSMIYSASKGYVSTILKVADEEKHALKFISVSAQDAQLYAEALKILLKVSHKVDYPIGLSSYLLKENP